MFSASSAVYALIPITYLAVRGIHIISSSKIKPENRVLLYTLMFARALGTSAVYALILITYLAVRGIHIISSEN